MSSEHYPVLIVIIPLLSAFITAIAGWFKKESCYPLTLIALSLSFYSSLKTLNLVFLKGKISYHLGSWVPPIGIEYAIDSLNAMVLVVITFVGLMVAIYSRRSVEKELPEKIPQFYTLFLLVITGLTGITITGDAFNLYVLLEIAALTGYALIAVGEERAPLASFNYIIMGTIGACFYLLGVGHLYILTGSLNMADLHHLLPSLYNNKAIIVGFILLILGVWVKMAFFPVHGWLPNAYTYAPSATSALIAPLMTKVSVYVMIRLMFFVFSPTYVFQIFSARKGVVWLAVIAIVAGAFLALFQTSFKKMLTYIIVAEVGYMVGGVWLANKAGLTGAILHILNDALMTLCLFLVMGIIVYKKENHQFTALKDLYRKMPFTMTIFTLGAFSMIGIPPTCGFFSKWYLLSGSIQSGHYEFTAALIFSSLINVILFFKAIEMAYYGAGHAHESASEKIDEAPLSMLIPGFIVAALLLIVGFYAATIINQVIVPIIPSSLPGTI